MGAIQEAIHVDIHFKEELRLQTFLSKDCLDAELALRICELQIFCLFHTYSACSRIN